MKKLLSALLLIVSFNVLAEELPTPSLPIDLDPVVTVKVPMIFGFETVNVWDALNESLRNPKGVKNIQLVWSGYGGDYLVVYDTAQAFLEAQRLGKKITLLIQSKAFSGHAYASCYASYIDLKPGGTLMFHAPYSWDSYAFGLIKYRNTNNDPGIAFMLDMNLSICQMKQILTQAEVNAIRSGYVIYITNKGKGAERVVTVGTQDNWCVFGTCF